MLKLTTDTHQLSKREYLALRFLEGFISKGFDWSYFLANCDRKSIHKQYVRYAYELADEFLKQSELVNPQRDIPHDTNNCVNLLRPNQNANGTTNFTHDGDSESHLS